MRYADFTWHDPIILLQGLGVSLWLFLATSAIGLALGIGLALTRYYRVPVVARLVQVVAEFLKNSPVLVQLFLVFFGLPAMAHINVTPVEAAMITLAGNTAAFVYVIAVSAMEQVGRDQVEAARVFGLTRGQIVWRIIAPQALAFAIGPLIGLAVNQLQVTSLVSVVGVMDLTKVGNILNMRTLKPFVVWTVVGAVYFIIARLIAALGGALERRLRAHAAWAGL
ncbi:amino acid ABC transporter permease [Radicibacter daui]|uniref:amino acid ABC transporter permease n=1 Tax=Radicibacter daui TaxID=3064829 RepID=UPI0040469AD8